MAVSRFIFLDFAIEVSDINSVRKATFLIIVRLVRLH